MRIIQIPHLRVGAILGPGGSHIKTMQVRGWGRGRAGVAGMV
jgi:hypothetical protein